MESSRPKEEEKRKTKQHITPRNVDRHEKNEQELDGTRKEDPGQSGLENSGRRPKLMTVLIKNTYTVLISDGFCGYYSNFNG
ncbi:unnamed protein product [Schistosoma margrebowiei]|uniref:Uncharacterized protein n=1 Tax=Schistosoma margrebowiei TaxID=48269 RepID=A0A183MNL7_9TREM|nr:unnamed protein product [Schistosoma margrebowiei]